MEDGAHAIQERIVILGALCEVRFNDETQNQHWYFSFGEHKDDSRYDSFGIQDDQIAFYSSWEEIPRLMRPDNGEDFRIIRIHDVNTMSRR
jgi:hypothetical protein